MAEIHDRMPLILAPADYLRWLSDDPDPARFIEAVPGCADAHVAHLDAGQQAGKR
jgi:putative SOS response-associated peptidase YedK